MRPFWGLEYLNPVPFYSWEDELNKFSAGPVQDPRDWAETYSAQLRSYPCQCTIKWFILILSKNYQAFQFSQVSEVGFNKSISHILIRKSKKLYFSMILIILAFEYDFCWIGKHCLMIFGQTLLILTKVCSRLQCSWWELDWGIRTLKKSAKFKLFKDFQLYSRFSSLLISRSYLIPTVT